MEEKELGSFKYKHAFQGLKECSLKVCITLQKPGSKLFNVLYYIQRE